MAMRRVAFSFALFCLACVQAGCLPHYDDFIGAKSDTDSVNRKDGRSRDDLSHDLPHAAPTMDCTGDSDSLGAPVVDGRDQTEHCVPSCANELGECVEATTGAWVCAPLMAMINEGPFWMGCNQAVDSYCSCPSEECAYHEVGVVSPYYIDLTEVTNYQFVSFLNENGASCEGHHCVDPGDGLAQLEKTENDWFVKMGLENHPMIQVTWFGARDYCEWRCPNCRLCSEAEWEKAARGGCNLYGDCELSSRVWPWGNTFPVSCSGSTAVYQGCGCAGGTCAVGQRPDGRSLYDVHDMAGNVWEWVADSFHDDYSGAPSDGTSWEDAGVDTRVVRGGAHDQDPKYLRTSSRAPMTAGQGFPSLGFRCCKSYQ